MHGIHFKMIKIHLTSSSSYMLLLDYDKSQSLETFLHHVCHLLVFPDSNSVCCKCRVQRANAAPMQYAAKGVNSAIAAEAAALPS